MAASSSSSSAAPPIAAPQLVRLLNHGRMQKDEPEASAVLVVQNTFLHYKEQAPTLQRSRSESTISDTSGSTDKLYVLYDTSESDSHPQAETPK